MNEVPALLPNTFELPAPDGLLTLIEIESLAALVEMNFVVPPPQALNSAAAKKLLELGAATTMLMSISPAPELTSVPLTTTRPRAQAEIADADETV